MATWKDADPESLAVAVVIDANPFSGYAGQALKSLCHSWSYSAQCYDITTDDLIAELSNAGTSEYDDSVDVLMKPVVGRFVKPASLSQLCSPR